MMGALGWSLILDSQVESNTLLRELLDKKGISARAESGPAARRKIFPDVKRVFEPDVNFLSICRSESTATE